MTKSTWVSSNRSKPDVYIKCQGNGCDGIIMFNAKEITDRKKFLSSENCRVKFLGAGIGEFVLPLESRPRPCAFAIE